MRTMSVQTDLHALASAERAIVSSRFFKTGKLEYGEGDFFLGVTVPDSRKIAKKYASISLTDVQELLSSRIHEERLTALLILSQKYKTNKKEIVDFYLKNLLYVNNWDLVDTSAYKLLGDYLLTQHRSVLYELVRSANVWERRIAIVSTFAFIRVGDFSDTVRICELLLGDKHDLIQKACGWMLREVGKKDEGTLIRFLDKNYRWMPRTMLRYAVERLGDDKKLHYMKL